MGNREASVLELEIFIRCDRPRSVTIETLRSVTTPR
jgi:hypothetical protein